MRFTLNIWRQKDRNAQGKMETYSIDGITGDMSFLEMLDILNDDLIKKGKEPVAFDHDCREGICGSCSMMVDGQAHGPERGATTCQLHMRSFRDGDTIVIEPWRASAFPVIRDLCVDRSAFDRIIQSGGYISVNTGGAPDGNSLPITLPAQERAMNAAECIGCGACVAACPNASAMLFLSAKVGHLGSMPQGKVEQKDRVRKMVAQHDREGFGHCTNIGECEAACPKSISTVYISSLHRDYMGSAAKAIVDG